MRLATQPRPHRLLKATLDVADFAGSLLTLLGRSKIESAVRYLGIEVDDAIEIADKIDS